MLTNQQISEVKGLLSIGHKQHDIAAFYGVNGGRIAEIALGKVGATISPAPVKALPRIKSPRFFTPQQTLAEQEAILADMIANPSDAARVHVISPELAESILAKRNGGNRQPSATKISEYIDAMTEGRWPVTGATIVFSKSGFLLDGQHRLLACVRSQIPLKTYVVFGIDDGAFTLIDIGRKRTNVDAFAIAKVPNYRVAAKATRWLAIMESDPNDRSITMTNEAALDWYKTHVDKALFDNSVKLAIEIEKATKARGVAIPSGSTAALLYLFGKKSRKDMAEFANLFCLEKGQTRAVVSVIREAMERSGGRIHEVYRNAVIVLAWNAFRAKRGITKSGLSWSSELDFPEIA